MGLTVHPEKSTFIPTQILTYLGFILNSRDMTVTMTEGKMQKIQSICKTLLEKHDCTIREFAMVIGNLVAAEPGVELAPIFYRRLEREKAKKLQLAKGNFEQTITLSQEARTDLTWWKDNAHFQSKDINKPEPQLTITTDSSDFAWGGTKIPNK